MLGSTIREKYGMQLASFSYYLHLGLQICLLQVKGFRNTESSSEEKCYQCTLSRLTSGIDHPIDLFLGQGDHLGRCNAWQIDLIDLDRLFPFALSE